MSDLQPWEDKPERDPKAPPLWQWVLLAIAPGLICDLLAFLNEMAVKARNDDLSQLITMTLIAAPLFGLIYLIVLGRRYARAGMSDSSILFVVGWGIVNLFLWGAGCCMVMQHISVH